MLAPRKIFLSLCALFSGPIIILLTLPFFSWSTKHGLITMVLVSGTTVYGVWRKPKEEDPPDRLWAFVRQCWIGEQQLWKIFWVVGVLVTAVLHGASYAGTGYGAPLAWWIALYTLVIPTQVWWMVSVWQCAKNTNKKIWEVLSKIYVVISFAQTIYNFSMIVAIPFGI